MYSPWLKFPPHTNRVGNLNFRTRCEPLANDTAGNKPAEVRAAAIYFGWVFSAEGPTSMSCSSAIGVYNDFSAGYTTIGRWATFAETTRWVYMKGYRGTEPAAEYTRSKMFMYVLCDFISLHPFAVLSRNHHVCDPVQEQPKRS